jgi:hypothetical protein
VKAIVFDKSSPVFGAQSHETEVEGMWGVTELHCHHFD